jgi:phosphatidylinositol alpha-1,6-mannosyltransferase
MKILLSTLEYPPQIGGVASYYANLQKNWPEPDNFQVLDNAEGTLLSTKSFWPWLKSFGAIYQAWRSMRADLVLIGQVLPLGTVAWFLGFIPSFKYGVFFHGLDFSLAVASPRKRFITRLILQRARLIVCANSEVARLLTGFDQASQEKIMLLNPGADLGVVDLDIRAALIEKYNLAGKKIILSLGRLVRRKGFDQVIKALDHLDFNNCLYLISGKGEDREYLYDLASASSKKDQIIFLENLSEAEKWSCLSLCDIFVMPSRNIKGDFEGFGIVYLEANLLAKPVIAGNSGGVRDAVVDRLNGLLVEPESTEGLAQALNILINDETLAKDLGERGRARALAEFNWSGQAEKLFKKITAI